MKWILVLAILSLPTQAQVDRTMIVEAPMGTHWAKWTNSEEMNVNRLLELLQRSTTGRKLVQAAAAKARAEGLTLLDVVKPGEGSLTDTTLIRKFHPDSPEHVVYESRSQVFINRHLAWREGLLDLAHELTHYVHREAFNPYTINFSLEAFIHSTIEGRGGEAHAFVTECRVMRELFSERHGQDHNCQQISEGDKLDESKARELFYHVGGFYDELSHFLGQRDLKNNFPHLREEKIKFISSAYGVPYPLAAIQEYQSVLAKVCENDKRRLSYMRTGRSPANWEKFRENMKKRCPEVSQN